MDVSNPKGHIVMMLDVEYIRFVILLNKTRTLKACHVHGTKEQITKREKKSYNKYLENAQSICNDIYKELN